MTTLLNVHIHGSGTGTEESNPKKSNGLAVTATYYNIPLHALDSGAYRSQMGGEGLKQDVVPGDQFHDLGCSEVKDSRNKSVHPFHSS